MEEESIKINLEERYKEALRKAREVREWVSRTNDGSEPSIAECLAYDMQYVEKYAENLLKEYKEDEAVIEEMAKYIKEPYKVVAFGSRKPKIEIIKEYFRNKAKEKKNNGH